MFRKGMISHRIKLPKEPISTRWSLLEALPRTRTERDDGFSFTLFEELCAVRPHNRLTPIGTTQAVLSDGPTTLSGYIQKGTGIFPTFWWVCPAGRVITVADVVRLWVWASISKGGENSQ